MMDITKIKCIKYFVASDYGRYVYTTFYLDNYVAYPIRCVNIRPSKMYDKMIEINLNDN